MRSSRLTWTTLNPFEIYLFKTGDLPVNRERILEAFRSVGWIRQLRADSSRFLYRNEDTGVFFSILMVPLHADEDLQSVSDSEEESEEETGGAEPVEAAPGEEPFDVEAAPITFTLPFPCPSFFGPETIAVAERIARAAGFDMSAGEHAAAPSDVLAAWDRANHEAAEQCCAPDTCTPVTVWTQEASDHWWRYGLGREQLETELSAEGVHVPRLQAAKHGRRVKSLCIWDEGTPAVFPRTDIVLIRRERERKGLFFTRRVKEEGLVSGDRIWDILAPSSEVREAPARLLIFREAQKPPQQVAAQLETLILEPVENAKRTELLGVVDFDVQERKEAAP